MPNSGLAISITSTVPRPVLKTTRSVRGKGADRPRHAALPASRSYDDWLIDRLKDPEEAAAYLEAAIEDGDQGVLMLALRHVALAQGGVAEIARRSRLTREATYRMLSKSGNPELKSFTAVLAAAGLRLSVKPASRVAPHSSRKQSIVV
jgi:probable addiction module antidote protein